ncbi:Uncharacterised protein [Pantoea agglomerans]|uniref:Uncharacterized protein n=1 Tax=Enterobacter agglomerans TaxID=549 RepID=A0A379ANG9_ENTAG|nr:Uncharacterised protein [Pantoea agglomerans]
MLRAESVRPATVAELQPVVAPTATHSEPGRFGALFRSREINLPKETLLKPLLEEDCAMPLVCVCSPKGVWGKPRWRRIWAWESGAFR